MCLATPAGVGLAVNRLDIPHFRRGAAVFPVGLLAFQFEHVAQYPCPGKGMHGFAKPFLLDCFMQLVA